jgi:hypothetical protein
MAKYKLKKTSKNERKVSTVLSANHLGGVVFLYDRVKMGLYAEGTGGGERWEEGEGDAKGRKGWGGLFLIFEGSPCNPFGARNQRVV